MDPERERIQADLRGIIQGEVHCDELFGQMYSSDASIYEIRPLGVIRPRSLADVVAAVKYGAEMACLFMCGVLVRALLVSRWVVG